MSKKKGLTLRQRLREGAEKKLHLMVLAMEGAANSVLEKHESNIDPLLLMQLASQPNGGKTLRHDLVTALANEAEEELERLYNNQLDLPVEEKARA
jgi:hypothetical protein